MVMLKQWKFSKHFGCFLGLLEFLIEGSGFDIVLGCTVSGSGSIFYFEGTVLDSSSGLVGFWSCI